MYRLNSDNGEEELKELKEIKETGVWNAGGMGINRRPSKTLPETQENLG